MWREREKRDTSQAERPQEKPVLLTLCSWTASLQSCEKINFCCLRQLAFGSFVKWKKVKVLVAQSCLTLCTPMDCSSPGFSVHGVLLTTILEWVDIPISRRSSQPRDQTKVSCIAGRFFTRWATREAPSGFVMATLKKKIQAPKERNFGISSTESTQALG